MATKNLSADILDRLLTQTVNVVRAAEGLSKPVLEALLELEKELVADLEDIVGKTDFTVTRMKALLVQARSHIDAAYGDVAVMSEKGLIEIATITARQVVAELNGAIGASVVSTQWSAQQLERIATSTIVNGSTAGDWWAQQSENLKAKFEREMRSGQLRGETVDQLAARVRGTKALGYSDGIMSASNAQAETLVRTSALGVSNAARLDTYAENDEVIKGVQWHSSLDPKTCLICAALDSLAWNFPGGDGNAAYADYEPDGHGKEFEPAPIHFNCRCVVIPVTYSWEELAGEHGNSNAAAIADEVPNDTRSSMDGEVAASTTFGDWLAGKDEAFQDEVLGPARAEQWRGGGLELSGLTDQGNNALTLDQLAGDGG